MKKASFLAVLALTILPNLASATCMGGHADQTAASCMAGTVWDEIKGTCVEKPTS